MKKVPLAPRPGWQAFAESVGFHFHTIDNYFDKVYLPWVTGDDIARNHIENEYHGVHEFKPHVRGECRTDRFIQSHPESIARDIHELKIKFNNQLKKYT
jgi:hypothetical protein